MEENILKSYSDFYKSPKLTNSLITLPKILQLSGFRDVICLHYSPVFPALQVGGLKHAFKYCYLWFPEMLKLLTCSLHRYTICLALKGLRRSREDNCPPGTFLHDSENIACLPTIPWKYLHYWKENSAWRKSAT